jgi:adenosylcobinamide kinase/adenosylcobinamide-phosphate guanylyltransferase
MPESTIARSELILGGQKSGKTARAESLAAAWLAQSPKHRAVYIATAQAWDDEMKERIARHRQDRAQRVPGMLTVEEPLELAQAIGRHGREDTLVVVDCLTLWLTARLMPAAGGSEPKVPPAPMGTEDVAIISGAIARCAGPLVVISNEIGLGVIPLGRDVRAFVDSLGRLNQEAAAACERVTLMSAGLPLRLKGGA